MTDPTTAYIGLGSNLQDPVRQVRMAIKELNVMPATRLLSVSAMYKNPPMLDDDTPRGQPDYVNAVAAIATGLEPRVLLEQLQKIEQKHQRVTVAHWGPRTLDLDLLLYGEMTIREPGLTVPHPGLPERAFVLYPLFEIAPELDVPGHGPLRMLKERCQPDLLQRIETEYPI
jgi:2-amino-4-hydroxy-6-hydroxymethyldihydropteridine diphosphokinase